MFNFFKYTIIACSAVMFTNCQGDTTKTVAATTPSAVIAPDMAQVREHAKGLCDCATPLLELKEQLNKYKKEGNLDKLQELLEKSDELNQVQVKCQEDLVTRLGEFKKDDPADFAILKEICPVLAESYENARKEN